ncbi:MBL fold metallo-hydrolase [Sandarakinorhabdus sp. AAP62]|uniref:MBL fold metallo-hydrolase n=1 Tax=Sandarakinorhabdus sp. AAP62 TaxID=1248916 RepID=UPI0002D940BD|nr:MBL fold metallo-hydrolase [Sandarakinorhabdus sp. AAP62]
MKRIAVGLLAVVAIGVAAAVTFQKQIGAAIFERAAQGGQGRDELASLPDGLHVGLCGTGSPMPNPRRAGPCNVVIAGRQVFVVDMGENGNRNLNLMGISAGDVDALLLTHFHSDHIDGIGPLMLYHWTRGTRTAPLPVHGPEGVEQVVAGFNAAYALDHSYRIAHHGEQVVPRSGGGAAARPFAIPDNSATVMQGGGLTVTAFKVDHDPIKPAVGYRFDYKGRALCISGDAAKSANLIATCKGADLIVHDALQPRLLAHVEAAFAAQGSANTAKIFRDIQDYHASPEQAAESAQEAGARMLVLSHLVPPLPFAYLYPAFLGDAPARFDGTVVVGEDGMLFSLPPQSTAIDRRTLM